MMSRSKLDKIPMDVVTLILSNCSLLEVMKAVPQLSKKWYQVSQTNQSNFWRRILIFQSRAGRVNLPSSIPIGSQLDTDFLASSIAVSNRRVLDALMRQSNAMAFLR